MPILSPLNPDGWKFRIKDGTTHKIVEGSQLTTAQKFACAESEFNEIGSILLMAEQQIFLGRPTIESVLKQFSIPPTVKDMILNAVDISATKFMVDSLQVKLLEEETKFGDEPKETNNGQEF